MDSDLALLQKELGILKEDLILLKSLKDYRSRLRAAARGLWNGEYTLFVFVDSMLGAIEAEFPKAWGEGAAKCGVTMSELTQAEKDALLTEISNESKYVIGLGEFILENQKGLGKLSDVFVRVDGWLDGYLRVTNHAQVMACGDKKLIWTLNKAEHCQSCLKLSGKVKRASYWKAKNVFPKSWDKLKCRKGCKCSLEETTLPLSKGPLPSLP